MPQDPEAYLKELHFEPIGRRRTSVLLERVADGVDEGMSEHRNKQKAATAPEKGKQRPNAAVNERQG
jgi:hypothetical protein